MMTFPQLVDKLGGSNNPMAIEAASRVAQQCLALGTPWIMVHPQHRMMTFRLLEYKFEDTFKQAWKSWKEEEMMDALVIQEMGDFATINEKLLSNLNTALRAAQSATNAEFAAVMEDAQPSVMRSASVWSI